MADFGRDPAEREAARRERERRRGVAADPEPAPGVAADPEPAPGAMPADGQYDTAFDPYDDEAPIGIRRVSRRDRTAPGADGADRAARPERGRGRERPAPRDRRPRRPPPRPAPRRRRRWIGRAIAIIPIILAIVLAGFLLELYQPFHGNPHGRVTIVVPAHAGSHQIGNLLAAQGVVSSGLFFDLRATLAGDRSKLLSGTYHLQKGMTYGAALKVLTTPPPAAKVTSLTTTPGHTRAGLSLLLGKQGVHGYLVDTRHSRLLNPTVYGAPRNTPTLEGFMFPDTYQLRVPISTGALVADQLNRFKQEFATVNFTSARAHHLTQYEVLIIASLVQAEAQTTHDMPLVASVIYNRLHDGIMLQFDSTTRYATGNFTKPLTVSELHSSSPWNTHTHPGLPPTPINNPGLTAIKAAANPPATNYVYFVSKPCSGALAFSADYTKFLGDVAAFNATQSQNGAPPQKRC